MTLAERIEAAGVEQQRAMLEEAYHALLPYNSPLYDHQHRARFIGLLDAEAYESAAMMLLPEGASWVIASHMMAANVFGYRNGSEYFDATSRYAATPALALAAAAIRAGAK